MFRANISAKRVWASLVWVIAQFFPKVPILSQGPNVERGVLWIAWRKQTLCKGHKRKLQQIRGNASGWNLRYNCAFLKNTITSLNVQDWASHTGIVKMSLFFVEKNTIRWHLRRLVHWSNLNKWNQMKETKINAFFRPLLPHCFPYSSSGPAYDHVFFSVLQVKAQLLGVQTFQASLLETRFG